MRVRKLRKAKQVKKYDGQIENGYLSAKEEKELGGRKEMAFRPD